MVAGKMKMNDVIESETDKKTFAFDVYNASMSFLNGCQVATEMIRAGTFRTAMVVTSEVEINKHYFPARGLGLAETGSAVILEKAADQRSGFSGFSFYYECDHFDARSWIGGYVDGKPCVTVHQEDNFLDLYLRTIPPAVEKLLESEGLDISGISIVLPPQISPRMNKQLANLLGIEPHRVVDLATDGRDLYTSSLSYTLDHIQQNGLARSGDIGLIINVASGIQVGCAIYYF